MDTPTLTTDNLGEIIIYHTDDGKAAVVLYARDGQVWMNQKQMAELFATSAQNIGQHISNILKDNELSQNSVIKDYFTTATDGKQYKQSDTWGHRIPKCLDFQPIVSLLPTNNSFLLIIS